MPAIKINRHLLFLVIAVVLGLVASLSAMHYVKKQAEAAKAKVAPHMQQVAVPVRNLDKGDVLSADDMAAREVPAAFVPGNPITPDNYENFVGGVLTMPVTKGVPMSTFTVESLANHFSDVIKPGDVAVSVQVDDINSISGLIVPGDRIDILLTMPGDQQNAQSRPLLSDVHVLATGQDTGSAQQQADGSGTGARNFSNVTLELSPLDAQRLSVARKVGELTVLLRRAGSDTPLELGVLTRSELLGSGRGVGGDGIQFIIGGRG